MIVAPAAKPATDTLPVHTPFTNAPLVGGVIVTGVPPALAVIVTGPAKLPVIVASPTSFAVTLMVNGWFAICVAPIAEIAK